MALLKALAVMLGLAIASALAVLALRVCPAVYIAVSVSVLLGLLTWAFYKD